MSKDRFGKFRKSGKLVTFVMTMSQSILIFVRDNFDIKQNEYFTDETVMTEIFTWQRLLSFYTLKMAVTNVNLVVLRTKLGILKTKMINQSFSIVYGKGTDNKHTEPIFYIYLPMMVKKSSLFLISILLLIKTQALFWPESKKAAKATKNSMGGRN